MDKPIQERKSRKIYDELENLKKEIKGLKWSWEDRKKVMDEIDNIIRSLETMGCPAPKRVFGKLFDLDEAIESASLKGDLPQLKLYVSRSTLSTIVNDLGEPIQMPYFE